LLLARRARMRLWWTGGATSGVSGRSDQGTVGGDAAANGCEQGQDYKGAAKHGTLRVEFRGDEVAEPSGHNNKLILPNCYLNPTEG
jgi:hypothetical protein